MCLLPADEPFLQRALDLAREAAALASPNPTVGCVLTLHGEVLGEGAHLYDKRDHAEIVALKQAGAAGRSVAGATAYVTLEPCSHHGRTGPCADALISAGIARCVVATVDPNPRVRGSGLAKLRAAGVQVCLLNPENHTAQQARRLNDAFAFFVQHGRPLVTLKTAVSLDGGIAPDPRLRTQKEPFWLTGPGARKDVHILRNTSDVLLTGIGTVLADDPLLTDRSGLPRRRPLLRAVLDPALRLPPGSKLVASSAGDLVVFTAADAPESKIALLRARGVEVILSDLPGRQLELQPVLDNLGGRGMLSVLLEAGSSLNSAFLRAGLVDRVFVYVAPRELGAGALPVADGISVDNLLQGLTGRSEAAFPHGSSVDRRFTGYLHDPWTGVSAQLAP